MNPTMPQEFESLCLMIEMGFYYKDSSKYTWNNFDELTAKVIESALSGRDRAGLFVIKNYLNRLLDAERAEEELRKVWKSTKPRVAFFDMVGASVNEPAIVYFFKRVRVAIEEKLATMRE
jgi:hypothetical protein